VPRKPREEVAGGIHHVYARGNNKALLFVDDVDREGYLWLLGTEVGRRRWRCLSYCLMDNHMHLLIETPEPNLGRGMQRLHGDFGRGFNRRHSRSGHVFQGRYGSKPVRDDEQLWTVAGYIAANPVEAGLCRSPGDWPWSSHAAVVGGSAAPAWLDLERLYERFESWGGDPRERYLAAVAGRGAGAEHGAVAGHDAVAGHGAGAGHGAVARRGAVAGHGAVAGRDAVAA
jgi:putative transposase